MRDPTRALDASCVAEMPGVADEVPGEPAELVLEPYTSEELRISGVVPSGWAEARPGLFGRAESAQDMAALKVAAEPTASAAELLEAVNEGYGLTEPPESTGERRQTT